MSVVSFMLPHLRVLADVAQLRVLANTKELDLLSSRGLDVPVQSVGVVRAIRPWQDLKALWSLYQIFKEHKPQGVHTITPKAGLLGMLAAWLAGVPLRVHSFTGQVWVTRKGPMRWILKMADRCIAALATDVLVDSPSQKQFLLDHGVVVQETGQVLAQGSICGVDTQRFLPNAQVGLELRQSLGTSTNALVCLYLGRLNQDKGVMDLATAFAQAASSHPMAELWVVGPDEELIFERMQQRLQNLDARVKRVGFTTTPERFMQAADLFVLPSYREGFGSSVIEAAACGVPALASRIYGLTDAVQEGATGWMHEAGNVQDLTDKIGEILRDPTEIKRRGEAARRYAIEVFEERLITQAMLDFYKSRLNI